MSRSRLTAALTAALALAGTAVLADPCEALLPRPGQTFSGSISYIGDGDGLCVAAGPTRGDWIEVRVADFYAPELSEPGGAAARAALARIAAGRTVVCVAGRRSFDRVVAVCRIGGRSLGDLMRAAGVVEGGRGLRASVPAGR